MFNVIKLPLIALPLSVSFWVLPTFAQVVPAIDGTGTIVTPNGDKFGISGGKVSADGANLFQSFERFNLNSQQTATFLSHPQIKNILGRVTGKEASFINGLIQVQGSNANLYLMNPAGILFGANASLNVPASFTATTATGIGFSNGTFNAFGTNDYNKLVGNPQSFVFSFNQVGAIANLGNLAVKDGQNLALIGGTVLNNGTLSAPGGKVTIATVEGGKLLKISQDGTLLNLEIKLPLIGQSTISQSFTPLSLAALLTGGELSNANEVKVALDGTVSLKKSAIPVLSTAKTTISSNLNVSSNIGTGSTGLDSNVTVKTNTGIAVTGEINTSTQLPINNQGAGIAGNITVSTPIANVNATVNTTPTNINVGVGNATVKITPTNINVGIGNVNATVNTTPTNINIGVGNNNPSISVPNSTSGNAATIPLSGSHSSTNLGQNLANTVENIALVETGKQISLTGLNRENNSIAAIAEIEQRITSEFQEYLPLQNEQKTNIPTIAQTSAILRQVESATGIKPALVYVYFVPNQQAIAPSPSVEQHLKSVKSFPRANLDTTTASQQKDTNALVAQLNYKGVRLARRLDTLEVLLITSNGKPIRKHLWNVTREQVLKVVQNLQQQVTDRTTSATEYLPPAQKLYNWIVAPIKADLKRQGIENLTFILDSGLRSIPIAALHDGEHFLVEDYSIGLMPSLSLTEFKGADIHAMKVLAMGASKFKEQNTLPTVPLELSTISQKLWSGESLLNSAFTMLNLKLARSQRPYGIVHLATHAEFLPGEPSNSYIQFWDQKLSLNRVREMGLNQPPVELLVLSACNTALGDEQAELGFAGMSLQAGVRSALASLWSVSDEATLALMTEFYHYLRNSRIKVRALQQVQIAMLKGEIRVENGRLITRNGEQFALPAEVASSDSWDLTHPIYWSAFTLIGNPW